jgi:hypothetical protein
VSVFVDRMSAKKTYLEMATEAIVALKDRTGSSPHAIKAHIVASNPKIDFQQVRECFLN